MHMQLQNYFKGRGFGSLISGAISDQIGVRSTLKIFGFACKYIKIFLYIISSKISLYEISILG